MKTLKPQSNELAGHLASILDSCLLEIDSEKAEFISDVTSTELTLRDDVNEGDAKPLFADLDSGEISDANLNKLLGMLCEDCQPHPYVGLWRAEKALNAYYGANQSDCSAEDTGLRSERLFIACRNSSGESDMFVTDMCVTQEAYDNDDHIHHALVRAEEAGYEQPFLVYSEAEQQNIARNALLLKTGMPFALPEFASDTPRPPINGTIMQGDQGISIYLQGHSDCCSEDDSGAVVFLEQIHGEAFVLTFADINREDATAVTSLRGARNCHRDQY